MASFIFIAVRSRQNTKSQPAPGQRNYMDEPNLPEIDYSLVTSTLFRIGRYQVDSSDETLKYPYFSADLAFFAT